MEPKETPEATKDMLTILETRIFQYARSSARRIRVDANSTLKTVNILPSYRVDGLVATVTRRNGSDGAPTLNAPTCGL